MPGSAGFAIASILVSFAGMAATAASGLLIGVAVDRQILAEVAADGDCAHGYLLGSRRPLWTQAPPCCIRP